MKKIISFKWPVYVFIAIVVIIFGIVIFSLVADQNPHNQINDSTTLLAIGTSTSSATSTSIPIIATSSTVSIKSTSPIESAPPVSIASLKVQGVLGLPTRIKIPTIGVDAHLEYVGLTSAGAIDAPKEPANAAWYDLGPRPGENGNAIIDGHYGWKNQIPAVFDSLHKVQIGDKIYIQDKNGNSITFLVKKIKIYGKNDDASSVFNSSDGKSHLNLITCGGIWDALSKSYSNRLVIFGDKEVL